MGSAASMYSAGMVNTAPEVAALRAQFDLEPLPLEDPEPLHVSESHPDTVTGVSVGLVTPPAHPHP